MSACRMEPIAITGMACRFPGAPSLDAFWQLLSEGRDGIGETPPDRWDSAALFDKDPKAPGKINARMGGFIEGIDRFDAGFFGITRREATQMDPQQRILLELTYEALEDAGIAPTTLAGSDTAVFVGAMTNDYFRQQIADGFRRIDVHTGSGAGLCMIANRLSYQFDLRGPSIAVDTACSSSLVAVLQACQSLWAGQSRLALAAGVNVMLDPAINVFYAKAGLSAADGRCKTFSAAADGIGRAEGAGVIVLKPLNDALKANDPIHAVIRGGAVNHDGRSNGLTQPNRWAQEQLLRSAFAHAGVDGRELQYIELHGTGTLIGDPIEANALAAVLTEGGGRAPCLVGSVKTNVGHLEAAAGIAGLIKLALSLARGAIPPSLWFDAPNPHIAFDRIPLRVNTELLPWGRSDMPRIGGVSSFGLGGANAHVVLESAPESSRGTAAVDAAAQSYCLFLSARSEPALKALAARYAELLDELPGSDLPAVCATALRRKGVHDFRASVLGRDAPSLIAALRAVVDGNPHPDAFVGRYRTSQYRLVLAVPALDRIDARLLSGVAVSAVATAAWNACRNAFGGNASVLPTAEAIAEDFAIGATHPDFDTWHFAVQYALSRLLLEDAATIETVFADGIGQLAVLAAINAIALSDVRDRLQKKRRRHIKFATAECQALRHAVHCDFASGIDPGLAQIDWSARKPAWHERMQANPDDANVDVLILGAMDDASPSMALGECIAPAAVSAAWGAVFSRLALRHALNWANWAGDDVFIRLPAYPWQRETYWLAPAVTSDSAALPSSSQAAMHTADAVPGLLGRRVDAPSMAWRNALDPDRIAYLIDHRVQGALVLPGAGYVEIGLAVHAAIEGALPAAISDLSFRHALMIEEGQAPPIHVAYDRRLREFTVHSRTSGDPAWVLNARGRLAPVAGSGSAPAATIDLSEMKARCTRFTDGDAHYANMRLRGFGYGPAFQGVRELWLDAAGEHVLAKIVRPAKLSAHAQCEHLHPALFDASLQSLLTTLTARGDSDLYIPTGIDRLTLYRNAGDVFWCYGGLQSGSHRTIKGDVVLFDDDGRLIAEAQGVRAQALTHKERDDLKDIDSWLYRWSWQEAPLDTSATGGRWLLLVEEDIDADPLSKRIEEAGASRIVLVRPGDRFERRSDVDYRASRGSREDLERVFEAVGIEDFSGVVYGWALGCRADQDGAPYAGAEAGAVLYMLQRLAADKRQIPAQLLLLTRCLQAVPGSEGANETIDGLMQAPLLGLARVAGNEFSDLRVRSIDIDHEAATLAQLALEIVSVDAEEEVALRAGQRFVHRMRRVAAAEMNAAMPNVAGTGFAADATYMVTGGFGGFGLEVAAWLVRQGARHLVLIGRRGASTTEVREAIERLRAQGAKVVEVSADISSESEVVRVLKRIRAELPRLDGVFHAAAVLDDAPIAQLEPQQIDRAMGAKAQGAWHLHRHTAEDALRYFVLFSSIASMVGGPGQASYAMSCSYLDALSRYRRARGLPAVSLNWGALSDVGMATRFGDIQKYLSDTGVGQFSPAQAIKLLEQALIWQPVELAIAKMEWRPWAAAYPTWGASPKYRDLLTSKSAEMTAARDHPLRLRLLAMEPSGREAEVAAFLVDLLAKTIETSAERIDTSLPLPSLGLDSLMAMDLLAAIEDGFGVKVPMLMVMKGNSTLQLAESIAAMMTDLPLDAAAASPVRPRSRDLPDELDLEAAERFIAGLADFDDGEVDRLLQKIMQEEGELQ